MRTALSACLLAVSATLVLAQADPATYYVQPDGNDEGPGTSTAQAFATIGRGIAALNAGDTLYLGDGVYREADLVVAGLRATPERPTVIKSTNRWGAKVEGVVYHTVLFKILDCAHIVLDGLEVYHPGDTYDTDWSTGIETFGSDYVTVRNCYAHDCGCGGFGGRTGDYLTFEGNVAVGNAMTSPYNCSGISIYHPRQLDDAPGPHIVVRDNVVFGNACPIPFSVAGFSVPTDGNGIILDDYANEQPDIDPEGAANPPFVAASLVEGNLAFGNGGAGIKAYRAGNVTVRGNTAYHNNYILAEYSGSMSEIGFEDATGPITVERNVGIVAAGRGSNAFYYSPRAGANETASLTAKQNLLVGPVVVRGGAEVPLSQNTLLPANLQSYAALADARDTVETFGSAEDFRAYFSPRPESPLLREPNRPLGAYASPVASAKPLPADPPLRYRVPAVRGEAIAVDGVREGFYTEPPAPIVHAEVERGPIGRWWAAYSPEALHLYVEVDAGGEADAVGIEVGSARRDALPALAGQFGFDGASVERHDSTIRFARHTLPDGVSAIEVSLPLEALLQETPTPGDELSLGLGPGVVALTGDHGDDFRLTGVSEQQYLLALTEPKPTPTLEPKKTGVLATTWPVARDLEASEPTAGDLSATWSATYDADSLYVLIDVVDDTLSRDDGEAWYDDDGIEVYLDADNAKTFMDYDENDYHIVVGLDGTVRDARDQLGEGARARVHQTEAGYRASIALPWSAIGGAGEPGRFLGFDVHVVDDDDGGRRDNKLSWFTERDQSYANAALFGTVVLGK